MVLYSEENSLGDMLGIQMNKIENLNSKNKIKMYSKIVFFGHLSSKNQKMWNFDF